MSIWGNFQHDCRLIHSGPALSSIPQPAPTLILPGIYRLSQITHRITQPENFLAFESYGMRMHLLTGVLGLLTQQTQNRCGIQPDVTGGHIMVAGRRRDANVTLSAADSMGEGRPQRQSCHSICARMDPAGGLCRAGPTD